MKDTPWYSQAHLQVSITMNHWSDSSPLAPGPASSLGLIETLLEYLAVALSHGHSASILPEDQSLHALHQITDGVDAGLSQPKSQDMDLGGS